MTTATRREAPHHNNLTCVKQYNCRRPECLERDRTYSSTRYRLQAYGRWQPFTDAEPIRAHVRMLMTYGIGWQRIARLAGVSNGGLSRLLYGTYGRGYGPTKRVRITTADKLLAVRPTFDNVAPSARVDATGTRRRLQALVANGWPQMRLGRRLGFQYHRMVWERIRGDVVEAATARQVRELYDALWNINPATCGVHPRFIAQAKRIAAANDWVPPAAWDDAWIDSPAAQPDLGEQPDRYTAIAEDAHWLIDEHGYTREQAARRLCVTQRHLERAFAAERRQNTRSAA